MPERARAIVFVFVLTALFLLCLAHQAAAPILDPGDFVWERTHGVPDADDRGYALAQAPDGGYVLAGKHDRASALWLVKTNDKGNLEWDQKFPGTNCDGRDVEVVADGYVLVGTARASSLDPMRARLIKVSTDGESVLIDETYTEGDHTIAYGVEPLSDGFAMTGIYYPDDYSEQLAWLIKTDLNGDRLWSNTFGTGRESGADVHQTADGGFLIIGSTRSYGPDSDIWVIKTDAAGNTCDYTATGECDLVPPGSGQWVRRFGGTGNQSASAGVVVADGTVITGNDESYNAILFKVDLNGDPVPGWYRTYNYLATDDSRWQSGNSVKTTPDGGFVIGGEADIGPDWDSNFLLIRTDPSGVEQWHAVMGGTDQDSSGYFPYEYVMDVIVDANGDYIFTGIQELLDEYNDFQEDLPIVKVAGSTGDYDTTECYPGETRACTYSGCSGRAEETCGGTGMWGPCACIVDVGACMEVVGVPADGITYRLTSNLAGYYPARPSCVYLTTHGAQDITIDCNGFTIDSGSTSTSDMGAGVYVAGQLGTEDRVTIENCTITGYPRGIEIISLDESRILNNQLNGNAKGINLNSGDSNIDVIGNTMTPGGSTAFQHGIVASGTGHAFGQNVIAGFHGNGIMDVGTGSTYTSNEVCGNNLGGASYNADIRVDSGTATGSDNTCDSTISYDDSDAASGGCANACATCTVDADCEDGLYCNGTETCVGGDCEAGLGPDCSAWTDPCNIGTCNEDADACEATPRADGASCDDGAYCTVNDACDSGTCEGGGTRDCSVAADQCNDGACNEGSDVCEASPKPDGTACDDGDVYTIDDECTAGTCLGVVGGDCTPGDATGVLTCSQVWDAGTGTFDSVLQEEYHYDSACTLRLRDVDDCVDTCRDEMIWFGLEGPTGLALCQGVLYDDGGLYSPACDGREIVQQEGNDLYSVHATTSAVYDGKIWFGMVSNGEVPYLMACEADGACTDLIPIPSAGPQHSVESMAEFNGALMVSLWNGDLWSCDPSGICAYEGIKGGHEILAMDDRLWVMGWTDFRVYDEDLDDPVYEEAFEDAVFGTAMEIFDNRAWVGLSNGDLLACDGASACTTEENTPSYNQDMQTYAGKLWLGQYDGHVYSCDNAGDCTDHGQYCVSSMGSDFCRISSLGVFKGRLVVGQDLGNTTAFDRDGNEVSAPWPAAVTQAGTVGMIGVFPEPAQCIVPECTVDSDCDDGFSCTTETCDDGACVPAPNDAFCPADASCATYVCDPILGDPGTGCRTEYSIDICRAAAGDCDAEEICSGSSPDCPPDDKYDASRVCRDAEGLCDTVEYCDGATDHCPADALEPAGTVCRDRVEPGALCDAVETCTGSDVSCPVDDVEPAGTVCRDAAGDCDEAEICDGSFTACPTDDKKPHGTVCREAAGPCDAAEQCNGADTDCPGDVYLSGSVCRPAATVCDVADSCDGAGPGCPGDEVRPAGFDCDICGACDGGGTCAYDDSQDAECAPTVCPADACGGDTCDPHIWADFPAAVPNECSGLGTCTANPCAGSATCGPDIDGDGFSPQCNDCDDGNGAVFPGAPERCDGVDNQCPGDTGYGATDEENAIGCTDYYRDADLDSYGVSGNTRCFCFSEGTYSTTQDGDCNDGNASVYPGAPELCDHVDNQCPGSAGYGLTDEGYPTHTYFRDSDDDGYGLTSDSQVFCAPEGAYDTTQGGDCNDANGAVFPEAPEVCDGVDNQCAGDPGYGQTDEGYADRDGDGNMDCVDQCVTIPDPDLRLLLHFDGTHLDASVNYQTANNQQDTCTNWVGYDHDCLRLISTPQGYEPGTFGSAIRFSLNTYVLASFYEWPSGADPYGYTERFPLDFDGNITLETWIRPDAAVQNAMFLGRGDAMPPTAPPMGIRKDYGLYWRSDSGSGNDGEIAWRITRQDDTDAEVKATGLAAEEWFHVVGTYDQSTGAAGLYVNGGLVDTVWVGERKESLNPGGIAHYGLPYPVLIGRFIGLMDETGIYSMAMAPSEVEHQYKKGALICEVEGPDHDGDGLGDRVDDDDDNDGEPDETDCASLDDQIYPGAVEVCNGLDDNCDDTIDEDCDVGGIGDDVEESNPGADVTLTDEDGDGVLEEGETCDIEIVTPSSDAATLANITGLEIQPGASPPGVGAYDESTLSAAEEDAALAAAESIVGPLGDLNTMNILQLDSSGFSGYLGTDDYDILIEVETALNGTVPLCEAELGTSAILLFCDGEYDLASGNCSGTLMAVENRCEDSCTDGDLVEDPTLDDICYKPTQRGPDRVQIRNVPHGTAVLSILVSSSLPGDLDEDGDVDWIDLLIILYYRNRPASVAPACDIDGDGWITVLDARKCVLLCTRPRCAMQ